MDTTSTMSDTERKRAVNEILNVFAKAYSRKEIRRVAKKAKLSPKLTRAAEQVGQGVVKEFKALLSKVGKHSGPGADSLGLFDPKDLLAVRRQAVRLLRNIPSERAAKHIQECWQNGIHAGLKGASVKEWFPEKDGLAVFRQMVKSGITAIVAGKPKKVRSPFDTGPIDPVWKDSTQALCAAHAISTLIMPLFVGKTAKIVEQQSLLIRSGFVANSLGML